VIKLSGERCRRTFNLPDPRSRPASFDVRPEEEVGAAKRRPVPSMMRSWSPTLFRKAFHIKGNDDLRWVSLTYALQVF